MPNVTATTAAKFIDEIWSDELNRAVMLDTVVGQMFADWSSKMQGHGQIFHLPARHNLTANTKSAGSAATTEAITETEQTFTVATHQVCAQTIEDFADIMSKYSIREEFNSAFSYSLARAFDVSCTTLFSNNTLNTFGVLGAEYTDDNFINSWTALRNSAAKAPFKGVVSPAAWGGMLKVDKFINAQYNGDSNGNALHEAQIGKVYQATFYTSQLLPGTAPNADGALWAGEHFFKVWKRKPTPHAWYSPLDVAWVLSADQIYGVFEKQEADEAAAATTVARLYGVRLRGIK